MIVKNIVARIKERSDGSANPRGTENLLAGIRYNRLALLEFTFFKHNMHAAFARFRVIGSWIVIFEA